MGREAGDCREIFELLSQYLDAELPPERCEAIKAHIAACAPCVEFLESLRQSIELCRDYQPGVMPGPLDDSARNTLEAAYRKMLETRKR